ncbi:MAG: hypothetical protein ACREO0_02010 [Pseudoxanthomonas sp.]
MLRISLALLLICASAHALAQNGRNAPPNPGACQETEAVARDDAAQAGAAHPKASAARNKYAKPASSAAPTSGGGGDDDGLQRVRGAKWHSFLPGMFR